MSRLAPCLFCQPNTGCPFIKGQRCTRVKQARVNAPLQLVRSAGPEVVLDQLIIVSLVTLDGGRNVDVLINTADSYYRLLRC